MSVPEKYDELCNLFESIEKGSSAQLTKFMSEAEYKYKTGIEKIVYKPGLSITEFIDLDIIKGAFRLQIFLLLVNMYESISPILNLLH